MSTSLRDQLLQAGLVSQKQVRDAEREEQRRQQRPQPKHSQQQPRSQHPPPPRGGGAAQAPAAPRGRGPGSELVAARIAQSAKVARDQALSRRQQEKARKKALQAQIRQLIEQNRLPLDENDEGYHFVDGSKIRRLPVNAAVRGPLSRGEVVIVCHEARYDLVPAAVAAKIRERDANAVIAIASPPDPPADDAYRQFSVPDDLIW